MGKLVNNIARQMLTTQMIGTKEIKGNANSPITTYYLSGEELEKYRALPVPVVEKSNGSKIW